MPTSTARSKSMSQASFGIGREAAVGGPLQFAHRRLGVGAEHQRVRDGPTRGARDLGACRVERDHYEVVRQQAGVRRGGR